MAGLVLQEIFWSSFGLVDIHPEEGKEQRKKRSLLEKR